MAFSDTELLILSQLSYYSDSLPCNEMLSDVLTTYYNALRKDLGPQFDSVLDALIKKADVDGCKIVHKKNDSKTGFGAFAISDNERNVTVVTRGTDGFDLSDEESVKDIVYGDIGIVFGSGKTDQHKQMEKFMDDLFSMGYSNFSFAGHSLGGNLAMFGAIYCAEHNKRVIKVAAFNAPQFNDWFCAKHRTSIKKIENVTVQYQNEYDIVSSINGDNAFGKINICQTADTDTNEFDFDDHYLYGYYLDEDGKFKTGRKKNSLTNSSINNLSDTLSNPIRIRSFWDVLLLSLLAVSFKQIGKFINDWILSWKKGTEKAEKNPYFKIDTQKMRDCANRIKKVSRDAKKLDGDMNSLYKTVFSSKNIGDGLVNMLRSLKVEDISDLACSHLDQAVKCLNTIADDFEKADIQIQRKARK